MDTFADFTDFAAFLSEEELIGECAPSTNSPRDPNDFESQPLVDSERYGAINQSAMCLIA